MRREFAKFITEKAKNDDKIVLIVNDVGFGLFDEFKRLFSDRYYNVGMIEQSMIGIASGLAIEGMKPWVYAITPFLIERPFEQIKLDIDAQNVNVKLVGYADYPDAGITHQVLDDKKMMSLFSNIKSYFPNNTKETREMLEEMYVVSNPCFISLKKSKDE